MSDLGASPRLAREGPGRTAPRRPGPNKTPSNNDDEITIRLNQSQIDQVIRDAGHGGPMTFLLAALWDPDWRLALQQEGRQYPLDDARLSRTLLLGLMVFARFRPDGEYQRVSEVAGALKMTPSTAHRYVSTLVAVGLLEREPELRMYRATRIR